MKLLLPIVAAALTVSALSADWQKELTPIKPGAFPLPDPLVASYRFGWGAFVAATGEFEFSHSKPQQIQMKVNARTMGAVRALWQMDTQFIATATDALRPIHLEQTERYRKETETTTIDFSEGKLVRLRKLTPSGKAENKPKKFEFPGVFDLHTALMFVRSQPLKMGDTYRLVVYPTTDAYLAKVTVLAMERLKVGGKTYDALKLELGLQKINKELGLEPHRKFKSAAAWLSDDKDRLLLKLEAEVFVGSVWAEMQAVKPLPSGR